ncbi:MAG: hypothetical protein MUC49_15840 [Raineya sp.]|jgi:hypothetical protein|nr:hypothetical protein [Raineya sp.]
MELHKDNPYSENGKIVVFDDGTTELDRPQVSLPSNVPFYSYLVKEGEYLDQICKKYYDGKADYPEWYSLIVADINNIDLPLDQSSYVGKTIKIPFFQYLEFLNT